MDLFYRLFMTTPSNAKPEARTCWKEMLEDALSGFRSTDQQLEQLIDQLERKS